MKRIVKKRERFNSETKSKQRIRDIGEVTTGEREINAMLDFVKPLSYKIETTFLEPTAGDGNFLVIILERKLKAAKKKYKKSDYLEWFLKGLSSIYAIELKKDNVLTSKKRLYNVMMRFLEGVIPFKNENHIYNQLNTNNVINGILDKNIIQGDFLELNNQTIYFYEYDGSNYPQCIKLTKKPLKRSLEYNEKDEDNKTNYSVIIEDLKIIKIKKETYEVK